MPHIQIFKHIAKESIMFRFFSSGSNLFRSFSDQTVIKTLQVVTHATHSTICLTQTNAKEQETTKQPKEDAAKVLSKWGCNEDDLIRIFSRCPTLRNYDGMQIQSKLSMLSALGLRASELVKIINCRPRFFQSRVNHCFDERLAFLLSFFESKEMLNKAIVRNPSLLVWDNHNTIKATFELYEELGVKKRDLIQMILSRPTIISRTSFNDEKMEFISRTGISEDSKMYKYVVTLIGVSRVETIREKVSNLAKFGLSDDEIFGLFGRSPHILTLSTDKVQRNMTFILATMKLDAKTILKNPLLLFANMDTVLKPRGLLLMKLRDMDPKLQITQPEVLLRAMRMTEKRFTNFYIKCHEQEVANELMAFYERTKEVKRLALSSKRSIHKGFPF